MIRIQVNEIVTVSSNTHQQVPVVIGKGLGFFKCFGVHDVELDVMTVQSKIGSDELCELADISLCCKYIRQESLVQQSSARFYLVHFTQRFNNCRGSFAIGTVGW